MAQHSNIRWDPAAACKRAGIPVVSTADIASLLGHRDSRMVERVYGRMDVRSLGRALQRRLGASEAVEPRLPPKSVERMCSKRGRIGENPDAPERVGTSIFRGISCVRGRN